MKFHILNGDALAAEFPIDGIPGETIVIREAFIDGPVSTMYDDTYWELRKQYIQNTYTEIPITYEAHVMTEFDKLRNITSADEVYLWFEDDLFCQCNMWFAIDFISQNSQPKFHRVFPESDNITWKGFGRCGKKDLVNFYSGPIALRHEDVVHIRNLWNAFVHADNPALLMLSEEPNKAIRFQKEVIKAQADRAHDSPARSRPYRTLLSLMQGEELSFYQIFEKFTRLEGIYGFGDSQVMNMLKELESQAI